MIRRFIRKNRLLFALFCFAVLAIFVINFPLSSIPEIFQYGSELGKIVYDLSIGYIVSYFFFFLVVFVKEEKDKQNINYRASLQTSFLVIEGYNLFFDTIQPFHQATINFPPKQLEVHNACLRIDPFHSPLTTTGSTSSTLPWSAYLKLFRKNNLDYISKVIALPYINSELFGILIKIEDCKLFFDAERRIFPTHKTDDFYDGTFMETALLQYFELVGQLEGYRLRNFKDFPQHQRQIEERKKLQMEFYK